MMKRRVIFNAFLFSWCTLAQASGLIFNATAAPPNLTIRPNINFAYPNAGIKITSSGFSLNGVEQDCQMSGNGYCLFSTSPAIPKTFTFTGRGQLTYILCSDGAAALNCQHYSTGFTQDTPTVQKAYVGSEGDETVSLCTLNATNGTFDACVDSGAGDIFSNPYSIAFNTLGTQVYVTNSDTIQLCDVSTSTGLFSNCNILNNTSFETAEAIVLNNDSTRAYVTDYDEETIWLCNINASNGSFDDCSKTGSTVDSPEGIALNSDSSRSYAVSNGDEQVFVCDINLADGLLSNCSLSGTGFSSPEGIALTANDARAYVTNAGDDTVSVCDINPGDGALTNCVDASGGVFNFPTGIALNRDNTQAYITNKSSDVVSVCDIIASNGLFQNCVDSGDVISQPLGIVLH